MKKHEELILEKIKKYAVQAINFKDAMDYCAFTKDDKTIAACVFNLSQIGELVMRLNDEFIDSHTQIPWRKIKGLRNRIVHDYEGVQYNIIWDILENFVPDLIKKINNLL